jgi:RNA polymerase sigma factor (sigma-70 family)
MRCTYRDCMQDREIVAAIVAGEPAGLAECYDRYAQALYSHCRSLLSDPADAADAVQDTFVVAATKLGGLREPDRLKAWLYAVARNECLRRLRDRGRTASLDEAAEMTGETTDIEAPAERAELGELVRAAIGGLNPGDREVVELSLRGQLDGADLASALGIPVNQAHALASRARGQLERSLGALLVARSGRESCPELAALLAGWSGELTVLLRKRVSRHIEQCEVCGERKRRELSPAMLLSALPVFAVPPGLRQQVLRLVSDVSPESTQYRELVSRRAEPFQSSGFPVPIARAGRAGGRAGWPRSRRLLYASAAALILIAAGSAAYALHRPAGLTGVNAAAAGPPTASSVQPTPAPTAPASSAAPAASSAPALSPSPAAPAPAPVRSVPPAQPSTGAPSPSPSPAPSPGTLVASPRELKLTGTPYAESFTLTAEGGPVAAYTVTVQPEYAVDFTVSNSSGSMAAGESVTVTVTAIVVPPPPPTEVDVKITITPGPVIVLAAY